MHLGETQAHGGPNSKKKSVLWDTKLQILGAEGSENFEK